MMDASGSQSNFDVALEDLDRVNANKERLKLKLRDAQDYIKKLRLPFQV